MQPQSVRHRCIRFFFINVFHLWQLLVGIFIAIINLLVISLLNVFPKIWWFQLSLNWFIAIMCIIVVDLIALELLIAGRIDGVKYVSIFPLVGASIVRDAYDGVALGLALMLFRPRMQRYLAMWLSSTFGWGSCIWLSSKQ